jgi:type I restriction enzyme, S subunit
MAKLPKGWIDCALGEVISVRNGYAFPSKSFRTIGVPLIRQSNLAGNKVSLDKCVYLDQEWLEERADFVLHKNDILIGMSGSLGKLCIYDLDQPALQNQRTGRITLPSEELIDWRYILEFLKTVEAQLLEKGKGLGVLNVSATDIESLPFRLAPFGEQRRIVAKLEKLLEKVDDCRKRLERIPTILKRFRQSVLAAACSGRLTTDFRGSIELMNWIPGRLSEL